MAYCSADGCYRTTSCGPYCRDNGNLDKEPAPMTTITDAHRADALRELLAKASGGPWYLQDGAIGVNPWVSRGNYTTETGKYLRGGCILNMVAHDERSEDAALIVALHNAAPALLDELDRLRTELTQTQDKAEKLAEALGTLNARPALIPSGQ